MIKLLQLLNISAEKELRPVETIFYILAKKTIFDAI